MSQFISKLESMGFTEHGTGGGCLAMMAEFNGASIYVTDHYGALPEESDWLVTAETDDCETLAEFSSSEFGDDIASAIDAAKTAIAKHVEG